MAWVQITPGWREKLDGLDGANAFLRLPGVVLSGHPDRHVVQVEGGLLHGSILKKEHRVPWRDRLASAWAGHGFVSKTTREARILQGAARAGVSCPEVVAHGAAGKEAFLLLREMEGMTDLRTYLHQNPGACGRIARELGQVLARMHNAGFQHGDLYAKHVYVGQGPSICLLDWQRARCWRRLATVARLRDLATLDATLAHAVAPERARLALLASYARNLTGPFSKAWIARIRRLSTSLKQKRRIRDMSLAPLPAGAHNLVWLEGEALCVTHAFREEIGHLAPDWLRNSGHDTNIQSQVPLTRGRTGRLAQRTLSGLGRWCRSWWRPATAPEVRQAALLFRLERFGVPCPKLLAFGHKRLDRWREHSFLLTEAPIRARTLRELLLQSPTCVMRATWLRQAGTLLRRVHEAGYSVEKHAANFADDCASSISDRPGLALTRVDRLTRNTTAWQKLAIQDSAKLHGLHTTSATDALRFFLGYMGTKRLTNPGRAVARSIIQKLPKEVAR